MDFQTAVKTCLNKYVDFNGRARRSEFWWFYLATLILSVVTRLLDNVLGLDFGNSGLLTTLASLAILLPSLAVGARRLHDTGRSGWWLLLLFAIIIGWIVLVVFWVQDSKDGDNQYGPNPKSGAAGGYPPPPPPNYGTGQYNG